MIEVGPEQPTHRQPPAARLAAEGGARRRRQGGRRRAAPRQPARRQPARRQPAKRQTTPRVSLLAVVVFVLVFAVAGGYVFYRTYASPPDYTGQGTGSVVVQVEEGAAVSQIGETLERADVVKSSRAFVQAARDHPKATSIQPGHYELRHKMEASAAFAMLLDPSSRVQAKVTIPEGKRLSEIFAIVAKQTDISADDLREAAKERGELELPSYAESVEGYLFPATYTIGPDATAKQVLRRMVDEYKSAAQKVDLREQARQRGMSPHELVTVASLVQGEVMRARDFPKVATVVYNRLDQGMRLEFSSTVNYALGQRKLGVSTKETQVQSPYNTYTHGGLPPGPINSPGMRALKAAVSPARGDWLYFVTTKPQQGITKFTSDYQQFLRFKAEFKRNTP